MKKIFTALLIVMTIFFASCSNNEKPVEVSAVKVQTVDGAITVTHDGKISLSDEQKILSPVSGNVVSTYFQIGQAVEEGQPLFKIGQQKDEEALLKARAALGESMSALARERSDLAHAEAQLRQKTGSAQEVDDKKFIVEERQAEVAERQAAVQKLEESAASGIVKAKMAGNIGGEIIQLGAAVTGNETVLCTIGKLNPVSVRVEISDEEKHLILSSPAAKATLKFPDGSTYPREGKINFVNSSTTEVIFDNPINSLKINDAVQLVIDGVNVPKALLVPESAVQLRGEDHYVFVVDSDKTAALKKISLGGKLGNNFIVNEGLKSEDFVVVDGLKNLRDGSPMLVTNEK